MLQVRFDDDFGPYYYAPHHTLDGYGYVQLPTRAQLLALDRALANLVWGNNKTVSENLASGLARRYGISIRHAKSLVHARIAQHVRELAQEFGFAYIKSVGLARVVYEYLESFDPY